MNKLRLKYHPQQLNYHRAKKTQTICETAGFINQKALEEAEHAIYTHGQNEIQESENFGKKKRYSKPASPAMKQKKVSLETSPEVRDGSKNMR